MTEEPHAVPSHDRRLLAQVRPPDWQNPESPGTATSWWWWGQAPAAW